MTWTEFCSDLRTVRDGGNPRRADILHKMGLIEGSQADAGGLVLTQRGRDWLTRIDRDTPILDKQLEQSARAFDVVLSPED